MAEKAKAKSPLRVVPAAAVRSGGRSARIVADVLRATAEELARVGYAALRMEEVARVAGVNKTTVYRRWPTKEDLVSAALLALPEDYFTKNKVVVLPLKYGRGHPTTGHPVSDVVDPADITKLRAQINCLSCHQPHASAQPDLLAKDQVNNAAFCASCHKDLTRK